MGTIRKGYRLRGGDVLDILEYHDGKYGAKGKKRMPKKKPTTKLNRYGGTKRFRMNIKLNTSKP